MTVLQSPIQFSDYIMPIGTVLKTNSMPSKIEDSPMLGLDGTFAPPGVADAAVISLEIEMGGGGDASPTSGTEMITLDDVNNEANQLYQRLRSGYQQLIVGTMPARYLMAQKRKFEVTPLPGSSRRHLTIAIELYAQDPRWLSTLLHTLAGSGSAVNSGSARSYPVITLTAGTNPSITVNPPGSSKQIGLTLTYTMGASDHIIIDCDPRNRGQGIQLSTDGGVTYTTRLDLLGTSGISNTLGTADTFPFFDPGTSTVAVGGTGTAASIAWRDAWGL